MRTVSRSRSRVVPAMSVTIARSLPASALSSELLPAFGGPTITACRPSRSLRPRSALASRSSSDCASAASRCAQRRVAERVERFVGEIDRGFDLHAHREQRRRQRIHALREFAVERAPRRTRGAHVAGRDQVGDRLGLGEVELAVEERAFAEFARARHARTERAAARDQLLQQHRAAVRLQLDHVLAGVAGGRGEIQRDAVVDGVAVASRKRA